MKNNIISQIESLSLVEMIEVLDEICKKYSLSFIDEPTIAICKSMGKFEVFWVLPGIGITCEGSPASKEFPHRDVETFQKISDLVRKFQEFLLGEEGIQKYKETEEDRT
jgi:hypothetical protein